MFRAGPGPGGQQEPGVGRRRGREPGPGGGAAWTWEAGFDFQSTGLWAVNLDVLWLLLQPRSSLPFASPLQVCPQQDPSKCPGRPLTLKAPTFQLQAGLVLTAGPSALTTEILFPAQRALGSCSEATSPYT